MRNFVRNHPGYKFDSVISQEINFDLLVAIDEMWVTLEKKIEIGWPKMYVEKEVHDENQHFFLRIIAVVLSTKAVFELRHNSWR